MATPGPTANGGGQRPSASSNEASPSSPSPSARPSLSRKSHGGSHRRVYSAVEGSMAQQALLEGMSATADVAATTTGASPLDAQAAATTRSTATWNEMAQTPGRGLERDAMAARRQVEDVHHFSDLAVVGADAEEDAEIEILAGAAVGSSGAEGGKEDVLVVGTPTRSRKTMGTDSGTGGSSNCNNSDHTPTSSSAPPPPYGHHQDFETTPRTAVSGGGGNSGNYGNYGDYSNNNGGAGGWAGDLRGGLEGGLEGGLGLGGPPMSVTSSTRSIPGSLVRPSAGTATAATTTATNTATGTATASRAYTDIIEDEMADHRDTENLEGLSIGIGVGYGGRGRGGTGGGGNGDGDGGDDDDDENASIISGVTTWVPPPPPPPAPPAPPSLGGGEGEEGGDNRNGGSGAGGLTTSRKAAATATAAAAAAVASAGAPSSSPSSSSPPPPPTKMGTDGRGNRRSSNASSRSNGGESGYVSSASGGAVSNDAFLNAMRGGGGGSGVGGGGGNGGGSGGGRTAPTAAAAAGGGGGNGRRAPRHHAATASGRAKFAGSQQQMMLKSPPSPPGRDTLSPTSLEDLPSTPTRTGGSIQGSLSTLGTGTGTGGTAAVGTMPLAAAPAAAAAASASAAGSISGGGSDGGTADLLLGAITDLRGHVDQTLDGVRNQNRSDFERVLSIMQNESSKRSALESRLHAQLLLQSEAMVAMEMKLLRLEAKVEGKSKGQHQQQHRGNPGPPVSVLRESGLTGATSGGPIVSSLPPISSERPYEEEDLGSIEEGGVPRAVRASRAFAASGASLASAVTDGFTVDDASTKSDRDASTAPLGGDDEGDEGGDVSVDGSASTPTFSSRHRTLDTILMDPEIRGEVSVHGTSTRATRGSEDGDGDSTLATSMTSTTRGSTVFTGASTRGESVNVRALSGLSEGAAEYGNAGSGDESPATYGALSPTAPNEERSQSGSPLTVQSRETISVGPQSIASHSIAASHISTAVVAPHRSRSYRIRHDRSAGGSTTRPLADRLVQFTTAPVEPADGADEVTVPDELDNLSDVAETFARSANQWREEYEARLDAVQKRYGGQDGE